MNCLPKHLLLLVVAFSLGACGLFSKGPKNHEASEENALDQAAIQSILSRPLNLTGTNFDPSLKALDDSTLWALGNCNCKSELIGEYFVDIAKREGALPEALVPEIRNKIRNDPRINDLASMGGLGTILVGLFASNSQIGNEIQSGISDKINAASPSDANIQDVLSFRFSAFPDAAPALSDTEAGELERSFSIEKQSHRWFIAFSTPNLWQADAPVALDDHGVQLLTAALSLTEWKYLFGLDKASDGQVFGGLTLGLNDSENLQSFDPRTSADKPRFVSGQYKVSFPNTSLLNLATKTAEVWTHESQKISLSEQAKLWLAAAQAHHRTRPLARADIGALFSGTDPMFPDDVHTLSFAFLSGMQVLLDGPFIDEKSRSIHEYAGDTSEQASLVSLARLSRSLAAWSAELKDLSDAGVDDAALKRLEDAPKDLKRAAQLSVQTILSRYTYQDDDNVALSSSKDEESPPDLATTSEVISSMILVEQNVLQSPHLSKKIDELMLWVARHYAVPLWQGTFADVSTDDIFWLHGLLSTYKKANPGKIPQWVEMALSSLEKHVGDQASVNSL